LGLRGSRCCASTTGAGKSPGREPTRMESASIPPAEEPITTSGRESSCLSSCVFIYPLTSPFYSLSQLLYYSGQVFFAFEGNRKRVTQIITQTDTKRKRLVMRET